MVLKLLKPHKTYMCTFFHITQAVRCEQFLLYEKKENGFKFLIYLVGVKKQNYSTVFLFFFFIISRQGQTLANTDILLAKFKYSGIL